MDVQRLFSYLDELLEKRVALEDPIQRLERFRANPTADGFITPLQRTIYSDAHIQYEGLVDWFKHVELRFPCYRSGWTPH